MVSRRVLEVKGITGRGWCRGGGGDWVVVVGAARDGVSGKKERCLQPRGWRDGGEVGMGVVDG